MLRNKFGVPRDSKKKVIKEEMAALLVPVCPAARGHPDGRAEGRVSQGECARRLIEGATTMMAATRWIARHTISAGV
jgi:hypothetical protein